MKNVVQRSEDDRALPLHELAKQLDTNEDEEQRKQAFEQWYELNANELQSFVGYLMDDDVASSVVEELTDDVVVLAMEAVLNGKFRYEKKPFNAYVKTIARNHCKSYWRKKQPLSLDQLLEDGVTIQQLVIVHQLEESIDNDQAVSNLIDILPKERWRQVIRLYLQDYSYREIAELLNVSKAVVRKDMERIKKYIQQG